MSGRAGCREPPAAGCRTAPTHRTAYLSARCGFRPGTRSRLPCRPPRAARPRLQPRQSQPTQQLADRPLGNHDMVAFGDHPAEVNAAPADDPMKARSGRRAAVLSAPASARPTAPGDNHCGAHRSARRGLRRCSGEPGLARSADPCRRPPRGTIPPALGLSPRPATLSDHVGLAAAR
jgi:hypothetical protein